MFTLEELREEFVEVLDIDALKAENAELKARVAELKNSLKELVSIVKIHQKATFNNFAWAELEVANEVLKGGAA